MSLLKRYSLEWKAESISTENHPEERQLGLGGASCPPLPPSSFLLAPLPVGSGGLKVKFSKEKHSIPSHSYYFIIELFAFTLKILQNDLVSWRDLLVFLNSMQITGM